MSALAIQNLRDHQQQLDADGCMVGVSRQALEETLASHADLLAALRALADEGVFSQPRFEEDTDTDYFLRWIKAIRSEARAAVKAATGEA